MIPQIGNEIPNNVIRYRIPSKTYRFSNDTVYGYIDGVDSVKQAICCILSVERYSNPIYGDNYGVELEQYLGKDINYINATIQNVLYDALIQDDRITDVKVKSVNAIDIDYCEVKFDVFTIFGSFDESISVRF